MATHSSILAWKTPWTVEPGALQFMGSGRVRHDLARTHTHTHTHTHTSGSLLGDLHVSSRVLLELTLVPSVCQAPFTDCSFRFLNNLFYKQKSKVRVDLLAFICSCFSHVFQYWAG